MEKIDIERRVYVKEKMIDDLTFRVLTVFSFLLPIFVIPGIYYHIPLAKAALLKVTAGMLLVSWAYYTVTTRRIRWKSTPLDLPLFLFVAVAALSSLLALNPLNSLVGSWSERFEELPSWIAYLVILVAAINYQGKFKRVATICKAMIAGSVVVSLYGVLQRFGYDFTRFTWAEEMRSSATLGNPILFAAYLNLVIPVAVALMLSSRHKEEKAFWGTAATLAGLTLIFTGSRGGWLGGIAGILVFLAILLVKRQLSLYRKELAVVAFALLLTVLAGFYAGSRVGGVAAPVQRLETARPEVGSLATRFSIWRSSLRMIGDRPLSGWGFENFRDAFGVYREELHAVLTQGRMLADRPHNQLLYVAFATGFFGLMFFLWLLFSYAGFVLRKVLENHQKSSEQTLLFFGMVSAAAAYLAQEQFSFSVPAVTPMFWLIFGLSLNTVLWEQATSRTYQSVTARLPGFLSFVAALLAIVLVAPTLMAVAADYNYNSGLSAVNVEGDLEAIGRYRKAIWLNPLKGEYRLAFARASRRLAYESDNPIWLKEAVPVAKKGIGLEPQSPDLYFALAELYFAGSSLGNFSDFTLAKTYAKQGLKRLPHSEDGRAILAESLIREGNLDGALGELFYILEVSPSDFRALYDLGVVFQAQGDHVSAAKYFRRALEVNPDSGEVRARLRSLETSVR